MSNSKPYKKGDYYLLPYAGKKRDLLVQLVKPVNLKYGCHWWVRQAAYRASHFFIQPGPRNCTPSRARRILASKA